MKTKTLRKKLVLTKETVADLTIGKMKGIHGGYSGYTTTCLVTKLDCPMTVCSCNPSSPLIVCACDSVEAK